MKRNDRFSWRHCVEFSDIEHDWSNKKKPVRKQDGYDSLDRKAIACFTFDQSNTATREIE